MADLFAFSLIKRGKLLEIGNRVSVGNAYGIVQKIGPLRFQLLELPRGDLVGSSLGRVVNVANRIIIEEVLCRWV